MIQLITADCYGAVLGDLAEMHRLRYRIFKERLGWDVQISGDMNSVPQCLSTSSSRPV